MIHTEYQGIPRSERKGPNVLVLAPTRELALQIEKGKHMKTTESRTQIKNLINTKY